MGYYTRGFPTAIYFAYKVIFKSYSLYSEKRKFSNLSLDISRIFYHYKNRIILFSATEINSISLL